MARSVACTTQPEGSRAPPRRVDIRPAKHKEPTMRTRAYAVILAALVALMAAAGASAKAQNVHAKKQQLRHSLVKQAQKAAAKKIDRRWGRANY